MYFAASDLLRVNQKLFNFLGSANWNEKKIEKLHKDEPKIHQAMKSYTCWSVWEDLRRGETGNRKYERKNEKIKLEDNANLTNLPASGVMQAAINHGYARFGSAGAPLREHYASVYLMACILRISWLF